MSSIFPATGIDNFTTKVDTSDYPTASHINDLQNAIITVQTKVGIDGSADTNSLDYKITDPLSEYVNCSLSGKLVSQV